MIIFKDGQYIATTLQLPKLEISIRETTWEEQEAIDAQDEAYDRWEAEAYEEQRRRNLLDKDGK